MSTHWKYQAPRNGSDKGTKAPLFTQVKGGKRESVTCDPSKGWIHETDETGTIVSAFHTEGNVRLQRVTYAPSITFEGAFWKTNITPALAWHIAKCCDVTYDDDNAVTGLGQLEALGEFGEAIALLSTQRNVQDEDTKDTRGGVAEMRAAFGKMKLVKAGEASPKQARRGA